MSSGKTCYNTVMQAKLRNIIPIFIIVLVASLSAGLMPRVLPPVQVLENWLVDFRFGILAKPMVQDDRIVIATITEETLATMRYRSPVDRGFLAQLLKTLGTYGVRAVGIDILFDQRTEPLKDEALRKEILEFPAPVIVAQADREDNLTDQQLAFQAQFTNGMNLGLAILPVSPDGVVRQISAGRKNDSSSKIRLTLPGAIARSLGLIAPARDLQLAYRPPPNLHRTPFAAALGTDAGTIPGVVIHAHALAQLLDGRKVNNLGSFGTGTVIIILAMLGLLVAAFDISLLIKGTIFSAGLVGFWILAFAVYPYSGVALPLLTPSFAFVGSCGGGLAFLGRRDRQQKKWIRQAFSRYLSPAVVDQLISDPSKLEVSGERREVTYLFTDLASFTALTERIEPKVLVSLLNEYIDGMCAIAFSHGATLDKIVGDAVVMFFNAPVDQPDHKHRAAACALDLDAFGQSFVERKSAQGLKVGVTRIGIHSGVAIIGNFGGENFFDYTGAGDMVNTAARLESVNKHLGTRVCMSLLTAMGCPDLSFRPVGVLVLKGKTEGIEVVEPICEGKAASQSTALYRSAYEAMARNDDNATELFQQVLDNDADDGLAAFHLGRLQSGEKGTTIKMGEK